MSDMSVAASGGDKQPFFTPPSLPKGGGTLAPSPGSLSVGGPDGGAGWQIPLPVSAGAVRTLAPQTALSYSNSGGHGPFGMGWQAGIPAIRLRTQHGVPEYKGADRINGPGGEELRRMPGAVRQETALPFGEAGGGAYAVTRYCSRFSGKLTRTERWEEQGSGGAVTRTFWIDYGADGSLSLYGWSETARVADPGDPSHIAEWHLEETVSARGEHILWRWRPEDGENCSEDELSQHPAVTNVYPDTVHWMNRTASLSFTVPVTDFSTGRWQEDWLACLVFDYGERNTPVETPPPFSATAAWPARDDALSFRRYGFEMRTRRLCHDILLWHRTALMADETSTDATPRLVSRLHLDYDTSDAVTRLVSAQQVAYEDDGTPVSLPPLEFQLSEPPRTLPGIKDWVARRDLVPFSHEYWQMADLQGDGIPGLLYRDKGAWWYREPVRATAGTDDITWAAPVALEAVPVGGNAMFADLNGDGSPELVLTLPGLRGTFTLQPNYRWGGFKPFTAFPSEFEHPAALQADLTGAGLTDLVMIGPASVRLWASAGDAGWQPATTVVHDGPLGLPGPPGDGLSLVALSDFSGSGLTDLVEITARGVTVWPSHGRGRFGRPVSLPGFSLEALQARDESDLAFAPERIYLADTDGSGVADILVIGQKGIHLFANRSGNRFEWKGVIPPPDEVRPDNTWRLQVADVRGTGMASLVLTVPHMTPQHWVLEFSPVRPWLLTTVVDNLGSSTELQYRSSAQGWLDEKAALKAAGKKAVSHLPFPVHTVSQVTQVNEITGLTLGSRTRYLGGVWDRGEREFAGFRRLIQTDVNTRSEENALSRQATLSPPAETRTWFFCGIAALDTAPEGAQEEADAAFTVSPTRFTCWQDGDKPETPDPESGRGQWLHRALRGQVMRTEVYGMDEDPRAGVPYAVSRQRFQVRSWDSADASGQPDPAHPVTLVTPVESLSLACERIANDPQATQMLVLALDEYGTALDSVSITCPRQLTPAQVLAEESDRKLYPTSLPDGIIRDSLDQQQYDCWITLTRSRVHHLTGGNDFVPGLPLDTRTDSIWWGTTHPDGDPDGRKSRAIPAGGFTSDNLTVEALLAEPGSVTLTGYSRTRWRGEDGQTERDAPVRQALVACTETVMLDEVSLEVLRPSFSRTVGDLLRDNLKDAGRAADPDTLRRLRNRGKEHLTPAFFFGAWNDATARLDATLAAGYDDDAGKQHRAMTGVLKAVCREAALVDSTCWRELKDEMGIPPADGMPEALLCRAVRLYGSLAGEHGDAKAALVSLQESLLKRVPDRLFWQVLAPVLNPDTTDKADPLPLREEDRHNLDALRKELRQPLQAESLEEMLTRGGYLKMTVPHEPAVGEAWGGRYNISQYLGADAFWLPSAVRDSERVPEHHLTYSAYQLTVVNATDNVTYVAAVTATDWRFLQPVQVRDTNDNITEATLDALGRVRHHRFYGTEVPAGATDAVRAGYTATADSAFTPPGTVEEALALNVTKQVPVHEAFTMVTDSWMPMALNAAGTPTGKRCGILARQRQEARLLTDGIMPPDSMAGRVPPHTLRIQTDRYDDDPAQQVRVQVALHGGGQIIQTAVLSPEGEALVRTEDGRLDTGADGHALTRNATVRWAVSGRTEFDNKGNPVRVWQPFYLDDWRWLWDDSGREGVYADTHLYDALSRETTVLTAAGYERWTQRFPWFTVQWDENDTLEDVLARRTATGQEGGQ